jgi:hypothetical protein
MDGDNRIPPVLIAGLTTVVLAVGSASYYAGRYRRVPRLVPEARAELSTPAAPAPDTSRLVETPAEVPPTITPSVPIVVERGRPSSEVLVQKSTQIVVPVPPAPSTAPRAAMPSEPTAGRRIVIEVRPTPTPTVPEVQPPGPPPDETPEPPPEPPPPEPPPPEPPPPEETPEPQPPPPEETPEPEPPPPEETPEPQPTARPGVRKISEAVAGRALPNPIGSLQMERSTGGVDPSNGYSPRRRASGEPERARDA